jgi:hypothetical protein
MLKQSNTLAEKGWTLLPYILAMVIAGTLAMLTGMVGTNNWPVSALIGFTAALLVGGVLFTFLEMRRVCK